MRFFVKLFSDLTKILLFFELCLQISNFDFLVLTTAHFRNSQFSKIIDFVFFFENVCLFFSTLFTKQSKRRRFLFFFVSRVSSISINNIEFIDDQKRFIQLNNFINSIFTTTTTNIINNNYQNIDFNQRQ